MRGVPKRRFRPTRFYDLPGPVSALFLKTRNEFALGWWHVLYGDFLYVVNRKDQWFKAPDPLKAKA